MAILNENLNWNDIIAANPDVQLAFCGVPKKELLAKEEMLCRFITTESKAKGIVGNNVFSSPWWMEWTATWRMVSRFKAAAPNEVVRARLAITAQFSRELDSLVQIILTDAVYGWKGIARHQDDTARRVTYIGGGTQIFIPNLARDRDGLSSRVAYMHCFTAVQSLS